MIKRQGKRAGDVKHPSPVDYYLEMSYRTLMRRFDWGYHVDHMFPCSPLGTYVPLPFELLLHIRSTLYHHHYSLYVLPTILTETKPPAKPSTPARRSRLRYHLATTTKRQNEIYREKSDLLETYFSTKKQTTCRPRVISSCRHFLREDRPLTYFFFMRAYDGSSTLKHMHARIHACMHAYKRRRQQQ
jgi:hypothetical protein